ncbi:MAG4270 family putative restriction endonuclease [Metamycoplasma auris]|uniref:Uncharacterized protein n=1 Tax=Metamycoplasma auris TaxID=51363 RepID=A0A2W7G616_9BACT|nr:hypothetical protein [Metamycoplasma auris]PZW01384.1 hypothetical protein BCF89_1024 [Metamycoplasma auris]
MPNYLNYIKYRAYFKTKSLDNAKSNSAKASGWIDFFIDKTLKFPFVEYWYINFDYVELDLLTTKSWFEVKNGRYKTNFRARKSLFDNLNLLQKPRKCLNDNELYRLNMIELSKLNYWFNTKYTSTLKNIISILKGNNAGGSFKNPNSAEIYITNLNEVNYVYKNNLIIFLDEITYKTNNINFNNYSIFNLNHNNTYNDMDQFIGFLENNTILESYKLLLDFTKLTTNNKKENIVQYKNRKVNFESQSSFILEKIKSNKFDIKTIDKAISKERAKLANKSIIVFEQINKYSYEKAHILDVKFIRSKLQEIALSLRNKLSSITNEEIQENYKYKEILNSISDVENILNLPTQIHDWFDKNYFTYNKKGQYVKLESEIDIDLDIEELKCSLIQKSKLSPRRIYYILQRNLKRNNDV